MISNLLILQNSDICFCVFELPIKYVPEIFPLSAIWFCGTMVKMQCSKFITHTICILSDDTIWTIEILYLLFDKFYTQNEGLLSFHSVTVQLILELFLSNAFDACILLQYFGFIIATDISLIVLDGLFNISFDIEYHIICYHL